MFESLGMDAHSQQVYEALVDRHPQTLDDLCDGARLEHAEGRRAVRSLEALGLVNQVPGSPVRYAVHAPDLALEVLFLERERQLTRARAYAEQLTARFKETSVAGDPAELIEVISGIPAIRKRWEQLQRGLRRELRGIDKPPYTVPSQASTQVEQDLLAHGVDYRVIYDTEGLENFHDWRSDIEHAIQLGEQARVLASAPTKLVIFDDRCAMLPLQPAPSTISSMIVVHRSGLLQALCALFEDLWQRALPLDSPAAAAATDTDRPTEEELRLLHLLATGMPDQAIAKHLGLSHRTLQRRLQLLLNRLGATSRFQAGLRAATRGWLTG
ncbi:TrmB family transcriptional regulator [Streptomyces boninensis]|uniref:TrmB family transcriptional regulator n=1 Tax=Streptomyces boninensis TaxID=2039455 RepID=UPI003B21DD67